MEDIKSKSFTLKTENGYWLGQVVLTSDGMFASVTDYGNLSFSWRIFGDNFMSFLSNLDIGYFGYKMSAGMAYIAHTKKIDQACNRFAEKILPPLQKLLKEEIKNGNSF